MDHELKPKIPNYVKIKKNEATRQEKQKESFDSRHKARNLPPMYEGDIVWIPSHKCSGKIISDLDHTMYKPLKEHLDETAASRINYMNTHKPVRFILSFVLSAKQQYKQRTV